MRIFIAISLPEEIKNKIENIQKHLPDFKGRLTEKENLHLTLKFLGEISPMLIENVKSKLSQIRFPKLSLSITKIGIFSFQNNPSIVWLKIDGADELQRKIDEALEDLLPKEARFMSHLTIARVKYIDNAKKFSEEIEKIKFPDISLSAGSFELMESTLTKQGPIYRLLETYKAII